nr:hypothetical protein [Tanacetum cinerariifolium]
VRIVLKSHKEKPDQEASFQQINLTMKLIYPKSKSRDYSFQKINAKTIKRQKSKSKDQTCKFLKVTRGIETAKVSKIKYVEEPQKKRVAKETLLQESFKKLKAVEVSGFESTQDTSTNDPKEMSEEDVYNMFEIVLVSEFKVKALQVKYPLIDWEIYSEGSITYWKIIRVGGITKAYQSFKDMLKGFDREDMVALWRLVKEKFSTTIPTVDK